MAECEADVVVDFWNPFAVMAARAAQKPVVTVIQADAHPLAGGSSGGRRAIEHPPVVPIVNEVLADYGLPPIRTIRELCVGRSDPGGRYARD